MWCALYFKMKKNLHHVGIYYWTLRVIFFTIQWKLKRKFYFTFWYLYAKHITFVIELFQLEKMWKYTKKQFIILHQSRYLQINYQFKFRDRRCTTTSHCFWVPKAGIILIEIRKYSELQFLSLKNSMAFRGIL